jgi:hypothetical protein
VLNAQVDVTSPSFMPPRRQTSSGARGSTETWIIGGAPTSCTKDTRGTYSPSMACSEEGGLGGACVDGREWGDRGRQDGGGWGVCEGRAGMTRGPAVWPRICSSFLRPIPLGGRVGARSLKRWPSAGRFILSLQAHFTCYLYRASSPSSSSSSFCNPAAGVLLATCPSLPVLSAPHPYPLLRLHCSCGPNVFPTACHTHKFPQVPPPATHSPYNL